MKNIFKISLLIMVGFLSSCDSKSTDPIDICVDAKIELYVQNLVTNYCPFLKENEEGSNRLAEDIIIKNQNSAQRESVDKFSKNIIKQHAERVKLCSNPTVSNFKKLDIRDNGSLVLFFTNDGEFPPISFRKECLEKYSR